jgi:hypothetical protein
LNGQLSPTASKGISPDGQIWARFKAGRSGFVMTVENEHCGNSSLVVPEAEKSIMARLAKSAIALKTLALRNGNLATLANNFFPANNWIKTAFKPGGSVDMAASSWFSSDRFSGTVKSVAAAAKPSHLDTGSATLDAPPCSCSMNE